MCICYIADTRIKQIFLVSRYAFCRENVEFSIELRSIRALNRQRSCVRRGETTHICCHYIGTNSTHSAERCSHVVTFRWRQAAVMY